MATYGTVGQFNPKAEKWDFYVERLQEFYVANGIDDAARKRAILNSTVGADTFKLIRDLLSPTEPKDATFDNIVDKLAKHYTPIKSPIIARSDFDSRVRLPNEPVPVFIAALRSLAKDCDYTNLEEKLRDRLVCGINDSRIKRALLAYQPDKLDFKRATEIALSMQFADQHSAPETVNAVQPKKNGPPRHRSRNQPQHQGNHGNAESYHQAYSQPSHQSHRPPREQLARSNNCRNCGRTRHADRSQCTALGHRCKRCNKLNHFENVCLSNPPQRMHQLDPTMPNPQYDESIIEDESNPDYNSPAESKTQYDDVYHIHTLGQQPRPALKDAMYSYVTVGLNNAEIKFQIDTGARCNVLPYDECQKLAASNRIDRTKASTLTAYGGTQVATLGVITLPCHSAPSTETHMLNFHVVDMPTVTPILDAHSSMQLGLVMSDTNVMYVLTSTAIFRRGFPICHHEYAFIMIMIKS